MPMGHYALVGQTPVPVDDVIEWARWFETADRVVRQERFLDLATVSTVFLGLDHAFGRCRAPVLFETMVFWQDEGGYEQDRCCTWLEAEEMHRRMAREVTRPRAVLAYAWRACAGAIAAARADWGQNVA